MYIIYTQCTVIQCYRQIGKWNGIADVNLIDHSGAVQ